MIYRKKRKPGNLTKKMVSVLSITCLLLSSIGFFPLKSFAYNGTVPDLMQVENNGNSAYLRWGVDMPPENVLYQTSFEPGQERPSLQGGGNPYYGNQSFSTDTAYGGSWSLKLTDTVSGMSGNGYWYPQTRADNSAHIYSGRSIPNNSHLSVTFKVKAVSGTKAVVTAFNGSPWGKQGIPIRTIYGEQVYYAQRIDWNYPPTTFRVFTYSGDLSFDTNTLYHVVSSRNSNHDYGILFYRWDAWNKRFVIDQNDVGRLPWSSSSPLGRIYVPNREVFDYGSTLIGNDWASVGFGSANIPIDNQWHTLSFNAKASYWNYDFQADGFDMRNSWSTNGTMYMDEMKMGYATQVKIYRNGQQVPLTEDQSYLSEYQDAQAKDTAPPSSPTNVYSSFTNGTVHLSWNPSSDNGTYYQYNVSSVNHYGQESPWSTTKGVWVTSGLAKYQIYKGSTLVGETTNNQMDMPLSDANNLSVVAIDNAGNKSNPSYTPNLTITPNNTNWVNGTLTLTATASDTKGIHHIQTPDGNWVYSNAVNYVVSSNGTYLFITVDNIGNQNTEPIMVDNIDQTSPTPPLIANNNSWTNNSSVLVSIQSGGDIQSGVNRTEYKLEGATNQGYVSYSQPISITNEGVTKITARTIDNVGNISSETTSYVRIDRSAPINSSILIQKK